MKTEFMIRPARCAYVHIPFCRSKCAYCAFRSFPAEVDIKEKYITRLEKEIRSAGRNHSVPLKSLYLGGGTPSELDTGQTGRIYAAVEETFGFLPEAERTIEVNPFSGSRQKLETLRSLGFNRLSVGVQSLSDPLLRTLGRPHSGRQALETLEAAREAGFSNISADLMFGLPGQTPEDLTDSIDRLVSLPQITHISAYSLSVEPGTRFGRLQKVGKLVLPDEDTERHMQYLLNDRLAQAGFVQYEISNYARPGFEAVHNGAYWDLTGYYGFGLSASSFTDGVRKTNTFDMTEYLDSPADAAVPGESHSLDFDEAAGDFMFLGLRRCAGVDDRQFQKMFGSSFFERWPDQIDSLRDRGLLVREGTVLKLTELGKDLANQVFVEFV